MKRAVLLDVSAIMYRAYFANINFRTKNEPTGAVYGFINTLLSIINEFKPDYMAAAFDVKRSSLKRTEIYGDYKSNRQSTPEDLVTQIPRIEEVLDAFNINRYKIDGYEADDVLGSLAKKIAKQDIEVIIITGDKDLSQLVERNISVALLGKGTEGEKFGILKNSDDVVNYLGVVPEKIPDLFGLIGDKSDGIPGVTKIGEKKALAIFSQYDSLEKIYENIDNLKNIDGIGPSLIKNLVNEKDIAFMSRELAKIFTDLDITVEESGLQYGMDREKLYSLCKVLEFKMFIKKLSLEEKPQNSTLFSLENTAEKKENPKIVEEKKEVEFIKEINLTLSNRELLIIDNENILNEQREYLSNYKKIASIYYENLGIILSTEDKDFYFPLNHGGLLAKNIDRNLIINFISELDIKFISYNFKALLNLGINFKSMYMDMMIAYHLISSQTKIDPIIPVTEYSKLEPKDFKTAFGKINIELITAQDFSKYLSAISIGILAIYDELNYLLKKEDLYKILMENEMPLIQVLSLMERKGIEIDIQYFKNYSLELDKELLRIEKAIYEEAGEEFNINSPKQLGDILFVKLNLPSGKKTKTGYSTDVMVLEDLESYGYNIARLLLDYRKLNKLKTTYVDTLPLLVDENSRIHTTFNQIGTATGRLSSSDPNLQNIPVKTDDGIKIREGFVAGAGKVLMSIDYSQVELRVLTSMSKDENLIEAYREEKDLHDLTARRIFNLSDTETVSREQRTIAKIINFSIIYGKTPFGLAKELKIPVKDASEYIKKYFEQYPKVTSFEREVIEFGEEHGYVKTLFGRKRYISGIDSKNKTIKSQAERMAVNTVIQGTAAEVLKKVMVKVYDVLKDKEDIALLLQVHDELIFEVEENSVEKYSEILADIMKNTVQLEDVKLNININIGKNWAEAK
ncbi:DNA-directed DNA polymerase [Fusobacterium sp. CM21]|uniref:DNA polymerase I n=2 Tax=Fusobacterium vincentii TaxID=155615 RepID=A0AAJ1CS80_FUSVC|nr:MULTISPECIES: DNA polymerase I [Fusobacterium]ETT02952.1 DNA-directed DNA polymerase [Fusobacterium sp. CM21]ERT45974.1 DNA polymerase I [Fusobacterium nucleatum CTI-7]MCW0263321.1 DNA polymerase I [Fusobacterium vincentii]OHU83252.1 DNA polymerase I [Fusobacterium nucleatum]STO29118.1 DNA polymerase I [Fusobacterium vincentii]